MSRHPAREAPPGSSRRPVVDGACAGDEIGRIRRAQGRQPIEHAGQPPLAGSLRRREVVELGVVLRVRSGLQECEGDVLVVVQDAPHQDGALVLGVHVVDVDSVGQVVPHELEIP